MRQTTRWYGVEHARLLLLSRPIDSVLAGPSEENFSDVSVPVEVEDEKTIEGIITRLLLRQGAEGRDPGPLDKVLERCEGDLYLLEFLVGTWLKEPSGTHALADVDEAKILDDVYIRYLRDADQRQNICSIAALSQFEIPVTSSWLGNLEELDSLKQNAFVESSVDSPLGAPVEFLQYFHSTPARYVVAATFHKGQLAVPSVDAFFLKKLRLCLKIS